MRVLVSATPITGITTGISRYTRSLYKRIEKMDSVETLYFTPLKVFSELPAPPSSRRWTSKIDMIWKLPDLMVAVFRTLFWLYYEKRLRITMVQRKCDIFHETTFFPPKVESTSVVFTLHDLSFLKYEKYHPRDRVYFYRIFFKKRLRYARHIITVSQFSKQEIVNELGISPEKVTAIPLAAERVFYPRSSQEVKKTLAKLNLPEKYILFVGTMEPRKNLKLILRSLKFTGKIPLVLVGWKGWGHKELSMKVKELGLEKQVYFVGYAGDDVLACLYSGAQAFVYPSLYEGFGLPVVEAMACGCPVICSKRASLPEVAGDAALYCDPLKPEQLAYLIDRVLEDSNLRQSLTIAGLKRSKEFNWDITARETVRVFRKICGKV